MTNSKTVLYIEDDENDVFLMQRAFKKLEIPNPLRIASDGKLALAYLNGSSPFEGSDEPCLVIIDLSMPGKHGLDVLKWIRNDPRRVELPVVVLTSSNQESDIHRAFLLRANGFITKPGDSNKLLKIVKVIQEYWLSEDRPAGTFIEFAGKANVLVLSGIYGAVTSSSV